MSKYKVRYCDIPQLDWYFYEIIRTPGEIPFTVLVEEFSIVGHRQFFCDIFHSREWDKGRNTYRSPDVDVCFDLWEHFGLNEEYGQFTPFYLSFPPSLRPPKVYRRTIEQVWDKLIFEDPCICSKLYEYLY